LRTHWKTTTCQPSHDDHIDDVDGDTRDNDLELDMETGSASAMLTVNVVAAPSAAATTFSAMTAAGIVCT
jgi:hypothetical protein